MKKSILLALVASAAMLFSGCNGTKEPPKPVLNVDETPISAVVAEDEYTIEVESNGKWSAVVDYAVEPETDWITFENAEGENDGTVVFKVDENLLPQTRTATIVISLEGSTLVKNVPVNQAAAEENLDVDTTPIEATAEGDTFKISVTSNTAWSAVVENADENDWVVLSNNSGEGDGEIDVEVVENLLVASRNTAILVSIGESEPVRVSVSQDAAGLIFNVTPTEINDIPTAGDTYIVNVTSNHTWIASEDSGWVTITDGVGSGNGSFTIQVDPTTSTSTRNTTVTVTPTDGTAVTIPIRQNAIDPILNFNPTSVSEIGYAGESALKVNVVANIAWTVSSSEGWASVTPLSGSGDRELTIRVDANDMLQSRTAKITLRATIHPTAQPVELVITQAGAPTPVLEFNPATNITMLSGIKEVSLGVTANVAWSITSSETWATITPSTGSGDGSVKISAPLNDTSEPRSTTLTLASTSNPNVTSKMITLTQEPTVAETGITINGITWATKNLDGNGVFAPTIDSKGKFFQFNSNVAWAVTGSVTGWRTASEPTGNWLPENDPCPEGWRVPTETELGTLPKLTSTLRRKVTNQGSWYGTDATAVAAATIANPQGCIFFPITGGYRSATNGNVSGNATRDGYYWTSTGNLTIGSYASSLTWTSGNPSIGVTTNKNVGYAVRCVKK